MIVLSLFDGISCGRIALERANISVSEYLASEIDEYAIKVAQHNYPNTVQLGDINGWRDWSIDWSSIDLIMAGSPCQGFSIVGDMLNFEDERSKLFFVFYDILNHVQAVNPNVLFLLENVKMRREWEGKITNLLGVEPIHINSALVSGQTRNRFYWTNIKGITQPKDKGIRMIDCLEKYVDEKFYLSERMIAYAMASGTKNFYCKPEINLEKARPLTTAGLKRAGTTNYVSDDFVNGGDKDRIRQLIPIEEERLQTLPEGYTDVGISNTQRRKCIGNGWTVDVIAHILSFIPNKGVEVE